MDRPVLVDDAGNDPLVWLIAADDLLASRDSLAESREVAQRHSNTLPMPRKVPQNARSYWVELMLVGFAIENLLKALWLVRGNTLYQNGKLQRIDGIKPHDLAALADRVGFVIDAQERGLLCMLSRVMIGVGRYPFSPNPSLEATTEGWSNLSDSRMIDLVQRLYDVVKIRRKEG